jgi:hypothetical protein
MRAAIVIVIVALVATDARGQGGDRSAELLLSFDREGTGYVTLVVPQSPGRRINFQAVNDGLAAAIPANGSKAEFQPGARALVWTLRQWSTPPEFPASRRLDLTPLLTALDGSGIETLRLTVAVLRGGVVTCDLPVRPASRWPQLLYRDRLATDVEESALEIRYGKRPIAPPRLITARAGRWSLALAALALLPLPLAARRLSRRATSAETPRLGHALWRLHKYGPLATTLAWLVALSLTGGLALATGWLDDPRPGEWVVRWMVLFTVPPIAATLLAARLARPALDRLRADDWGGVETLKNAPSVAIWRLVALALVASAVILAVDGYLAQAATVLLLAAFAGLRASFLSEPLLLNFDKLPDGELFERFRSLARTLGVKVKGVGIVNSPTRRAEVIMSGNVALTPPLLRDFARTAVDALVAQRFAERTRPSFTVAEVLVFAIYLGSALFAGGLALAVLWLDDGLSPGVVDWIPLVAAVDLAIMELAIRLLTRAKAQVADGRAASLTDPGMLVSALAEQERLRGEPPNRSRFEDAFLPRACVAHRAAALARRYEWTTDDVAWLLTAPVGAEASRYAMPQVAETPGGNPGNALIFMSLVGLPLAFACAAEACPPGVLRMVVLAAGIIGVPLLYAVGLWFIKNRRNTAWGRELRGRLRAEGVDADALSGIPVAFAPDREPHSYNGSPQWDLGYLVPAGDRLLYIGRRARTAVPWAAAEISFAAGALSRWPSRLVVTWDGGAFSVWPVGRFVPWGHARAATELRARLQDWRDRELTSDSLPAAWANLPPPPPTPQGATTFRESLTVRGPLISIAFLGGIVLVAAGSIGLPSHAAWYAFALVVVTVLAYWLPAYWLSRHRRE